MASSEPGGAAFEKLVLVTRKTRLAELVERFNTRAQAKFYLEHAGLDFDDYEDEDDAYAESLEQLERSLAARPARCRCSTARWCPPTSSRAATWWWRSGRTAWWPTPPSTSAPSRWWASTPTRSASTGCCCPSSPPARAAEWTGC